MSRPASHVFSSISRGSVAQTLKSLEKLGVAVLASLAFGSLAIWGQTATPPASATNFGSSAVGTPTTPTAITFTVGTGGTLGAPLVLTQGTSNLDFQLGSASTCAGSVSGGSCTVNVVFKPLAPGLRRGAVQLSSSTGSVIATAFIYGNGVGPRVAFTPGLISTVAGTVAACASQPQTSSCGDGGPATAAQFDSNVGLTVDAAGNIYIVDRYDYRVRKINAATGLISTVAGTRGKYCDPSTAPPGCLDGGPATQALLNVPNGVAVDGAGNLYITDSRDNVIRKVTASTGIISTVASGQPYPWGITVDRAGDVYFGDVSNNVVRKLTVSTGVVTTVAGNGTYAFSGDGGPATSASFQFPYSVAVDAAGNLYITDSVSDRIRKVSAASGIVTTIAGSGVEGYSGDGGLATNAALFGPRGIVEDGNGNLYFGDVSNNVVRKIDAAGIITTVAGGSTYGYTGDGGPAVGALIGGPFAVAIDSVGNLYVADTLSRVVRKVTATPAPMAFASTLVGTTSTDSPHTVSVSNTGTAPLNLAVPASGTNPAITAGYVSGSSGTCPQISASGYPAVLAAGAFCTEVVSFHPVAVSTTNTGSLTFNDDNLNVAGSTQSVALSGISTGTTGIVTPNITLTVPTTAVSGAAVGGTAQFSSSSTSTPTGNITIYALAAGSTTPVALTAVGSSAAAGGSGAAFSFTAPATAGTYSIYASYAGDTNFNNAFSSNASLTVVSNAKGTVTLNVYAPAGEVSGTAITGTVSAVISGSTAIPTGSVVVTALPINGNTNPNVVLGTFLASTLATAGAPGVSIPFTAPAAGFYNVTATYGGDTNFNSASPAFSTINVAPAATPTISSLSAVSSTSAGIPFNVTVTLTPKTASTAAISGSVVITATPSGGSPLTLATIPASQAAASGGAVVSVKLPIGGNYVLTTSYPGDLNYGASTASIGVVATGGTGTILLSGPTTGSTNVPVTFTLAITNAHTSSGVPIVLSSTLGGVAGPQVNVFYDTAITGTTAQLVFPSPGTYVVNASFPGDATNPSASSSPLTIVITPTTTPTFSFSADNPSVLDKSAAPLYLIDPGSTASTVLTLTAVAGFNTQVLLTYTSTNENTNLPFDSRLHIVLKDASGKVITAATPVASGTKITLVISGQTIAALNRPSLANMQLPAYFAGGLLCVGLAGFRKRSAPVTRALRLLGIVLVVGLSATLLSACNVNGCGSWTNDEFGTVDITATPANATQGASPQTLKVAVQLNSYFVN